MRPLYIVPGILGSQLLTAPPLVGGAELWLGKTRLALGEFRGLALDAAGTGPHPSYGQACTPGLPLPDYYGTLSTALRRQLPDRDVIDWGYDWRLRLETTGEQLAAAIRARATAAEPAELVVHSQGGLLARVTWRSLVSTGQTALVRRIVAIGTPWRDGSYAVPVLWSGDDPDLRFLFYVSLGVASLRQILLNQPGYPSLTGLVQITATWPAIYELLPPPVPADGEQADPMRAELYDLARWPLERGISAAHLAHAAGPWRTVLADPASVPPPEVLTIVVGRDHRTPTRLLFPSLLGRADALGYEPDGDGRVSLASATVRGVPRYYVSASHGDLIQHAELLASIGGWVSEVRLPGPPADPVTVAGRMPDTVSAPIGNRAASTPLVHDC